MKRYFAIFLVLFTFPHTLISQVKASYNGQALGKCHVSEAAIGGHGEKLFIHLYEQELRHANDGVGDQVAKADPSLPVPECLGIELEVFFKNGVPFPITPKDNIAINLSAMQFGQEEQLAMEKQAEAFSNAAAKDDGAAMKNQQMLLEQRAQEISKKMQSGEMSPEEAMKELDKITQGVDQMMENSAVLNMEMEEVEEKSQYWITFIDTHTMQTHQVFSGTLYIHTFNENEFVATLSGQEMVECLGKRASTSAENEQECGSTNFSLFPGMKILKEGPAQLSINAKIERFDDHR